MDKMIHSYKSLRKTVGLIGILLPFILLIGGLCDGYNLQPSISYYYHTNMGDVFVGALCAIALFLFFYTGYDNLDNILGNLAGVFALGVAFFPTSKLDGGDFIGTLHLIFAVTLFLLLSAFSLVLFTRGDKNNPQKKKRNIIYRICGIVIILSITSVPLLLKFVDKSSNIVYFAEATALIFFGISWLTKGGDLFFPDIQVRKRPYRRKKYLLNR